ncbi:hypothetical protein Tco_0475388, partial [Tanacetum coccineum]
DDILREKLRNINLLIAKIESLNDNLTPDFVLKSHSSFPIPVKDSDFFLKKTETFLSLPELETFRFDIEEKNSGSTTVNAENSLPEYDLFHFEIESDHGKLSRVVMETIDEIDAFLDIDISTNLEDGYHDSGGDIIYLESLLINNTIPNLSPARAVLRKRRGCFGKFQCIDNGNQDFEDESYLQEEENDAKAFQAPQLSWLSRRFFRRHESQVNWFEKMEG